MFFEDDGTLTAQNAATAVRNFWVACAVKLLNTYHFQVEGAVDTIDLATGKPTGSTAVTAADVVGTQNNDALPWATQGLVEWRTGFYSGGREVRGRTFIPGNVEIMSTSGVPTGEYTGALQTAANALISDALSQVQVYSRKHTLASGVTGATVWPKWAVLRSRRD